MITCLPARLVFAFLLLTTFSLQSAGAPGKPVAELTLPAPRERSLGSYRGHENHTFREQTGGFRFGPLDYALSWKACVDQAHGGEVSPLEGCIGMPSPTSCNWYHSGFLFLYLNGEDLGTTPLSSMLIAERGERAILDLVWRHELANVRARFAGLPGSDHLTCEIALEPKQELTSIAIGLRCYPSFFTSHHKRAGARRIQTPGALMEEGKSATLGADENWWGLYYDEVFDVAKGEGEGPCGLLFLPDEAVEITFEPGEYAVNTRIAYRPEARRLRLAFWDFKGLTNAEALARLRGSAQRVRQEVAGQDFTPAAVKSFDIAGLRVETERALKSPAAKAALGERIQEVTNWLDREAPALEQRSATGGIEAEESLLRSLDTYNSFVWEVKLAELLEAL